MASGRKPSRRVQYAQPVKRRSTRRVPASCVEASTGIESRAPKVGDAVEIWWSVDKVHYRGTLTHHLHEDTYRVAYDDGELEHVNLTKEQWRFSATPDKIPNKASTDSSPPALPRQRPSAQKSLRHQQIGEVVDVVVDGSDAAPDSDAPLYVKPFKPKSKKDSMKMLTNVPGSDPQTKEVDHSRATGTGAVVTSARTLGPNTVEEILEEGGIGGEARQKPILVQSTGANLSNDRHETIPTSLKGSSSKSRPKQKIASKSRKPSSVEKPNSDLLRKSSAEDASAQPKRKTYMSKHVPLRRLAISGQLIREDVPPKAIPQDLKPSQVTKTQQTQQGTNRVQTPFAKPAQNAPMSTHAPSRRLAMSGKLTRENVPSTAIVEGTKGAQVFSTSTQPQRTAKSVDNRNSQLNMSKYAPSRRLAMPGQLIRKDVRSGGLAGDLKGSRASSSTVNRQGGVGSGDGVSRDQGKTRAGSSSDRNIVQESGSQSRKSVDGQECNDSDDVPLLLRRNSSSIQEDAGALKTAPQRGMAGSSINPLKEKNALQTARNTPAPSTSSAQNQNRAKAVIAKMKPENTLESGPDKKSAPSKSPDPTCAAAQNSDSGELVAANDGKFIPGSGADHSELPVGQVNNISSDGTNSAKRPSVKKDESIRSRSSSEKANISFAAKRKKKKRQSVENGAPSGGVSGMSRFFNVPVETGTMPTSTGLATNTNMGNQATAGTIGAVNETGTGSAPMPRNVKMSCNDEPTTRESRVSSGRPRAMQTSGARESFMSEGTAVNAGLNKTVDGQAARSEMDIDMEVPAPAGGKRDRAENGQLKSGAGENGTESALKRRRQGSSPSNESLEQVDSSTLVTSSQLAAALAVQRDHIRRMVSPLQDRLGSVGEDIQRVMSIILSFKQQLEFYKDVVYRGVVDEGRSVRSGIKEFGKDMVEAIDGRATETELRLDETLRFLIPNSQGKNEMPLGRDGQRVGLGHPSRPGPSNAPQSSLKQLDRPRQGSNQKGVLHAGRNSDMSKVPHTNGGDGSATGNGAAGQGSRGNKRLSTGHGAADGPKAVAAKRMRVSHLVARQVTVWLLETPHEYNPRLGSVGSIRSWAKFTALRTFAKVQEQLLRFTSYNQAYQTLCSSLGNDAVELQWFLSPGATEHLIRARQNYSAWDPPPSDDEWRGEVFLLRELAERFDDALDDFDMAGVSDLEACVKIAKVAARDIEESTVASKSAGNRRPGGVSQGLPSSSGRSVQNVRAGQSSGTKKRVGPDAK